MLGDDGFDQAIGARLGWLADQKIGHAHIRLSPDDMGPVDVRLQLNGDKVHASFSSPHVDVRQALESSLPRLRELLGEQGFQLAHADVGHQSPGGEGNAPGQPGGSSIIGDGEPTPGDASVSSAPVDPPARTAGRLRLTGVPTKVGTYRHRFATEFRRIPLPGLRHALAYPGEATLRSFTRGNR